MAKLQVKRKLLDICSKTITDRIDTLYENLESIRAARNNETKSSAGDKYETGRAIMQIEEDNYKKQLHQALLLKNQLEQININRSTAKADLGSLVITDVAGYFISIGLGEITLAKESYYCISPASPIGQKVMNQTAGYKLEFNGKSQVILEIY